VEKEELLAVIEKSIGGDESAFEALYTSQSRSILFGVRSWLYDSNDMEDAASEVVLSMYKNITNLKSPYAYKAWMQRIIMTVCVDMNKRTKKQKGLDLSIFEAVLTDDDVTINPELVASKGDKYSYINVAISALPKIQKHTVLLYYYEDMNYQEISEALNVSQSTVSTNLTKARKKLKGMLEMKGVKFTDLVDEGYSGSFAAMITGALNTGADSVASPSQVSNFLAASKGKIQAYYAAPVRADVTAKTSFAKSALIIVSCAVVITGAIAAPQIINGNDAPPVEDKIIETVSGSQVPFVPDADITFIGDVDSAEHINPTSANVTTTGVKDEVVGWHIYNVEKEEMTSGQGTIIEDVFAGLEPGTYSLTWDIQNEQGAIAQAVREFSIE
jgi:RNA polymerase sigma-70 factor (ECF subfamily)